MNFLKLSELRAIDGGTTEDPPECDANCQAYNTGHIIGEIASYAGQTVIKVLGLLF